MSRTLSFLTVITVLVVSCASPSVVTIYKYRDTHTPHIHAVLVAAVMAGEDTMTRRQVEKYFSLELKKAGYHAVPLATAFGATGLSSLGQEEMLMKLCNYGFDAVLTVALIDGQKEKYKEYPGPGGNVAGYYLERIWNYEKIQADPTGLQNGSPYFWESILFDLYSLRPLGAVQTQSYSIKKSGGIDPELARRMIAKMMKDKVLGKGNDEKRPPADQRVAKQ